MILSVTACDDDGEVVDGLLLEHGPTPVVVHTPFGVPTLTPVARVVTVLDLDPTQKHVSAMRALLAGYLAARVDVRDSRWHALADARAELERHEPLHGGAGDRPDVERPQQPGRDLDNAPPNRRALVD